MEPACEYLDGLGLKVNQDYNPLRNLGFINAFLTPEQAAELRKQPFVRSVVEDFEMKLIE